MPREKSPERKKAETLLRKGMKAAEIAERLGVPAGTVRRWKAELQKENRTRNECSQKSEQNGQKTSAGKGKARKTNNAVKRHGGAQPGNVNSIGNEGGGAPLANKNAEIHGLYAKYLPPETMEIIDALRDESPLDMLWKQILNQQAVILRSQKIFEMHRGEKTEEVASSGEAGESYLIQEPWDKEAQYLAAFSRAQGTLQSMIKSYMEMEGKTRQEAAADSKDWKAAIVEIARRRRQAGGGGDSNEGKTQ